MRAGKLNRHTHTDVKSIKTLSHENTNGETSILVFS